MSMVHNMTIKDICIKYSITQTDLSRRYGIPLRSVQHWYAGTRQPPEYLLIMLDTLLSHDL